MVLVGLISGSHKWTGVHSYVLRASYLFLQVESISLSAVKLVHQVARFKVSEGGGEIEQVGVGLVSDWARRWMNMFFSRFYFKGKILWGW